ncbi:HAD family hydrolase [Roseovarius spongiae]|uniref:HAD family hydrolase n=1 Tax=Roseovarius spongiae TaxID=2320272 RepID=A0A3A8B446_9RHOB|nr:HAD-IA family hydrolase [Roseovarius spongiae]RKF12870.1 HAD family hydrolase [Roseovarius spongiae]
MSAPPRLILFDVDGTLVDSQGDIVAAMTHAFGAVGLPAPARADILGIVGLSLPVAMARLAPELDAAAHGRMVEGYKDAYMDLRALAGAAQSSPLYPGAREVLETLAAAPDVLLGVATGKSRRGLDKLLEAHDLRDLFVTQQVADFHPSKPHPAMILAALAETGIAARDAVMIGDTSFDMDMAQAAGVRGIGVGWGYHPRSALSAASAFIAAFAELPPLLDSLWESVT